MKGIIAALMAWAAAVSCTGEPPRPVDGWTVAVHVEPSGVSPIAFSVGQVRAARSNDAHPWVQHKLVFENTGDRLVRFADTRTSAFIGPSGHRRRLLAADEGCGYVPRTRGSRLEVGVCLLYLDAFRVKPHASVSRTVTLFQGLRGMEPLSGGRYVFRKVIRFRIPHGGTRRAAVLRLVYEIRPATR